MVVLTEHLFYGNGVKMLSCGSMNSLSIDFAFSRLDPKCRYFGRPGAKPSENLDIKEGFE